MRYISFIFSCLLFVLLLGFFLKNQQSVDISYHLGLSWQMPLPVLILLSFTAGILATLMASLVVIVKQRRALIAQSKTTQILNKHA